MASRTSASELFNPSKSRWRLRQGHGYRATPLHTNQSRLRHRTGVPPYSRQKTLGYSQGSQLRSSSSKQGKYKPASRGSIARWGRVKNLW